jgi:hypothetical protein
MSNEKTVRQIFDFILSLDESQFKIAKEFMSQLEYKETTKESAKVVEELDILPTGTEVEWTGQFGDKFTGYIVSYLRSDVIYEVRIAFSNNYKFPCAGGRVRIRRENLRLI